MANVLDQSQTSKVVEVGSRIYVANWGGQVFTAGTSGYLMEVKLWLRRYFTPTADLVIEIRNVASNKPGATIYSSNELAKELFIGSPGAEFDIILTTPVLLTSGTEYAIVIHEESNGGDATNNYSSYGSNVGDPYPSGSYFMSTDSGATWGAANDAYFLTYMGLSTNWNDLNCDIRCAQGVISDLNCDIRCVSEHPVLRDVNCDIRCLSQGLYDLNCDIRCVDSRLATYDVNADIRCTQRVISDINCDIRCVSGGTNNTLDDINCDIRCFSRTISDINCDIRCTPGIVFNNINCDIRCRKLVPANRDTLRIKVGGNYLSDVDVNSIKYNLTSDETPGQANFRLARYSDDFNRTLSASASSLANDSVVEIFWDSQVVWYGYILGIEPALSGEEVIVQCVDRKYLVQDDTASVSYGRGGTYDRTGTALKYILDLLVSDGIIASYTGLPNGIVPEFQQCESIPRGTLITELLDISGNYRWFITVDGILKIIPSGSSATKTLPMQTKDVSVGLYEVVDFKFKLNDKSNLITTLEVVLGTLSEQYSSFYLKTVKDVQLIPAWDRSLETELMTNYVLVANLCAGGLFYGSTDCGVGKFSDVFRRWKVQGWTDGSVWDKTAPALVRGKIYGQMNESTAGFTVRYKFKNEIMGSWGHYSVGSDGCILFDSWLMRIKSMHYASDMLILESVTYELLKSTITGRYYRKEDIGSALNPTIFNTTWVGNGGVGRTRRLSLGSLTIRDGITWQEYQEINAIPDLVFHEEPAYNDTNYAVDRARLMLSRTNDLISSGQINLTPDAWKYFGISIGDRVNLSGTTYPNIYNSNNGFPLDIVGYSFDGSSHLITLNVEHSRAFVATENFR